MPWFHRGVAMMLGHGQILGNKSQIHLVADERVNKESMEAWRSAHRLCIRSGLWTLDSGLVRSMLNGTSPMCCACCGEH